MKISIWQIPYSHRNLVVITCSMHGKVVWRANCTYVDAYQTFRSNLCDSLLQVLIKVSAAGVNPVDTYIRSGTYARLPELPYTPGSDAAGVVEGVGSEVTRFKV